MVYSNVYENVFLYEIKMAKANRMRAKQRVTQSYVEGSIALFEW